MASQWSPQAPWKSNPGEQTKHAFRFPVIFYTWQHDLETTETTMSNHNFCRLGRQAQRMGFHCTQWNLCPFRQGLHQAQDFCAPTPKLKCHLHASKIDRSFLPRKRSWRWRAGTWDRWSHMFPSFPYTHASSWLSKFLGKKKKKRESEKPESVITPLLPKGQHYCSPPARAHTSDLFLKQDSEQAIQLTSGVLDSACIDKKLLYSCGWPTQCETSHRMKGRQMAPACGLPVVPSSSFSLPILLSLLETHFTSDQYLQWMNQTYCHLSGEVKTKNYDQCYGKETSA